MAALDERPLLGPSLLHTEGLSTTARAVTDSLDASGALDAVRAQLHAAVLSTLAAHGGALGQRLGVPTRARQRLPAETSAELAAAGLVLDYLRAHALEHALDVARAEAEWPSAPGAEREASIVAGCEAGGARPLLVELLLSREKGSTSATHAQPSSSPSRPRTPSARGAAGDERAPPAAPTARAPAAPAAPRAPAPSPLEPLVFVRTHAGGSGLDPSKPNQDACFVLRAQRDGGGGGTGGGGGGGGGAPFDGRAAARSLLAVGVFDGHGGAHGAIAARAACASMEAALGASGFVEGLEADPSSALRALFEQAHEAAVEAMHLQPGVVRQGSGARSLLLQRLRDDADGSSYVDVTDGGTTASLLILVDGRHLFTASAGDSSGAMLAKGAGTGRRLSADGAGDGGRRASGGGGGGGGGRPIASALWSDHTPLDPREYERMKGCGARFVYDLPNLFDSDDQQRPIWADERAGGRPRLSAREEARARALGVACKSVRGELSALVLSPPSARFSQIGLTVTRSLGDVYMHGYGVTPLPEVHAYDLLEPSMAASRTNASATGGAAAAGPSLVGSELVLVVGTDGFWDLWTHDHIADRLWACDACAFDEFVEATRAEGERKFGEASDNFTLAVVRVAMPAVPGDGVDSYS